MSILSIQSHVAYGYVGNKAATYPLQAMGYDVWPINTVQFSNHTGYGKWRGEIFPSTHIGDLVHGLQDIGVIQKCKAVLSGYMGSREICEEVQQIAKELKTTNPNLLYLCDPVMGNDKCYVKPEVVEFFKTKLSADIITPNKFEAETLSGLKITDRSSLKKVADYFHDLGVKIVVITSIQFREQSKSIFTFASDTKHGGYLVESKISPLNMSGTGDLFSALYLGHYLATNQPLTSLQAAVFYTNKAVHNSIGKSELQVLSVNYRTPSEQKYKRQALKLY